MIFIQAAVGQVVQKFQDIDPDVWCKILYLEYEKVVAKFNICVMIMYNDIYLFRLQ